MPYVKTYYKSTSGNVAVVPNFKVREMASKDGADKVLIDYELMCIAQLMRDIVNTALKVNSGYRTKTHNKNVGGADNSYHLYGRAMDLSGYNVSSLCNIAYSIGVKGIIKYPTFVHIDTRANKYHATNKGQSMSYTKINIPYQNKLLKLGTKDYLVGVLQFKLNQLGYNAGTVDGIFGNNTLIAVKNFQTAKRLEADGKVGKNTWNALFN